MQSLKLLPLLFLATPAWGAEPNPLPVAGAIDREIDKQLAAAGLAPAPVADDAEFCRRVHLDLTGRIPTHQRVAAFLDDPSAEKRQRLIDELLASPAYGKHVAHRWRDYLTKRDPDIGNGDQPEFVNWLAGQFNRNDGWDKVVAALLTASGKNGDPAVHFLRWNLDMQLQPAPSKLVGVTANLFMGLPLQCAECHAHPHHKEWKRDDFWGLAAFFSHTRAVGDPGSKDVQYAEVEEAVVKERQKTRSLPSGARIEVPNKLDERKVDRIVPARFFQGEQPELGDKPPFRAALAQWLTTPGNNWFAPASVNRIWWELFGRGFVNPVDDMRPDNAPSHPQLLALLAKEFTESGYDRKHLLRCICNSKAYQRTAVPGTERVKKQALFGQMGVRMLTADQLLDSWMVAQGIEPESVPPQDSRGRESPQRPLRAFNIQTLEDSMFDFNSGVPQVLKLMNSNLAPRSIVRQTQGLTPEQAVTRLYLMAYGRRPSADELQLMTDYAKKAKSGYDGVFIVLLNSFEFCTNH